MTLIKDTAIILRRLDYSESSQVLVAFTREHGNVHLLGKGQKRATKSKPSIGIDMLELGHVVFSQRPGKESNLATMTEWKQLDHFGHLRRDLAALHAGLYAAEVVAHLTELHDPHPALFDELRTLLTRLACETGTVALPTFLWRMLEEIGLRPETSRCTNCARELNHDRIVYFSSREGGAVCRDCEPALVEKRTTTTEVLESLRSGAPDPDVGVAAFDLLDYHLTYTLGRPVKLAHALRECWKIKTNAKHV